MYDYDSELKPQEFEFTYNGKSYVLKEATADAARQWRNANLAGATMKDGRITIPDRMADSETILVAACLFERFGDPVKERPMIPAQIYSWPDRITRDLFERAKAMAGLDQKNAESSAKNLQTGGAVTSDLLIGSESTSTS